jgi:hypothetical protein
MTDQASSQSATQDQSKFKIKVAGQDKEVSREEIIEMAQKGEDYTRKTQAIADRERELKAIEEQIKPIRQVYEEMAKDKGLSDRMTKTYDDYKSGKISRSEAVDQNKKILDRKIDEAQGRGDRETIDSLKDIRDIIGQEADVRPLMEKINQLESKLKYLESSNIVSLDKKISSEIDTLKSEYGKEVVEKYEKLIRDGAIQYPNQSVDRLFKYFAEPNDLDEAVLKRAQRKKDEEVKQKKNGSMAGFNTMTEPIEPAKDKHGRTDFRDFARKVKEKYGL